MMTPKTTDESPLGGAIAQLRGNVADRRTQWTKGALKARLFGDGSSQRRIGRYTVGKCLGAGGMGEVYAAHDEALDRSVALKLLHSDVDVDVESRARMLREAKTLAKLSHPNVVQIYEVGEDDGQIFIAMEFIAGTSLRQWLATEARGWREVLGHYLEAGRGLAAVHRAGLVHRDFKPDNVLLGEDGRVCVADFGLARPIGGGGPQRSGSDKEWAGAESSAAFGSPTERDSMQITRTNRVAGTPAYMAPEQLRGQNVDARSDQFGFCVALYEGLYDQRPFEGRSLATRIAAMDEGPSVPPRRSQVPRRLWRLLVRGLAVDPNARFPSLDVLLRALDPARTRRRRALVVSGFAAMVGTAAMIATAQPPDPCPRPSAEDLGWGVEERAHVGEAIRSTGLAHAATTADTVLERLDDRAADLARVQQNTCEATHVRRVQPEGLFEQRMFCLEGVEGQMRGVIGALVQADAEAVDRAVNAIESLPQSRMCVSDGAAYGMLPPASPEQAIAVREARDHLARAQATLELGHPTRAREELKFLHAGIEAIAYQPLKAELYYLEGRIEDRAGKPTSAVDRLLHAGELADGSRHDLLAAEIWTSLALLGLNGLSPKDANRWLPRARAAVRRIESPPRLQTTISRYEGILALHNEDLQSAYTLLSDALDERRAQGDLLAVAKDAAALATVHSLLGDPKAALALHDEQREIYNRLLGPTHPHVGDAELNIGITLLELGEGQRARRHLESALTIWTQRYGADYLNLARVHIGLQQVELLTGTVDRALYHSLEARRLRSRLPPEHVDAAEAEMVVGISRFFNGELDEAAKAYRRAWTTYRTALGEGAEAALARANLAEALLYLERYDEAQHHADAAWRVLQSTLPDHPASANALKVRGEIALENGNLAMALENLQKALGLLETAAVKYPIEYGRVALVLSRAFASNGNLKKAHSMAKTAREAFAHLSGEVAQRTSRSQQNSTQDLQQPNALFWRL